MPFLEHFGLATHPFGLTPDSQLYFPLAEIEAILAAVDYAVMRGDGLLKIVGEVGSGKTMLCRLLLNRMAGRVVNVAYVSAPVAYMSRRLPSLILQEFGVRGGQDDTGATLRDYLLKQHGKGRRNVLVSRP